MQNENVEYTTYIIFNPKINFSTNAGDKYHK